MFKWYLFSSSTTYFRNAENNQVSVVALTLPKFAVLLFCELQSSHLQNKRIRINHLERETDYTLYIFAQAITVAHYACVYKCACLVFACRCQRSRSGVCLYCSLLSFCPLFRDSWSLHWAWGLSIQLLSAWDLPVFGLTLHVGSKNMNSGPHAYAARRWAVQWVFICCFLRQGLALLLRLASTSIVLLPLQNAGLVDSHQYTQFPTVCLKLCCCHLFNDFQ